MSARLGALLVAWGAVLTAIFLAPSLVSSRNHGDDLIRNTVRLALIGYLVAAVLMLNLDAPGWRGFTASGRAARVCWTLAWLAYVIHVVVAFHYAHHWSHAEAVDHVKDVSGFGPGIFMSYLFMLAWTVDVFWWLLRPLTYAERPAWIDRTLHAFMAFIIFNGTVVYETGFIRWAGVVLFLVLGLCLGSRRPFILRGETP